MIQTLATLYESDFAQWLDQTIKLLRENRFSELDLGNLVEEMESLDKSQRSAITLEHLLGIAPSKTNPIL
jgi:Domain of unknown function DUF29